MEAGAFFHEDPGRMTAHPAQHAVRDSDAGGSGWLAFAVVFLLLAALLNLVWGITALSKQDYFAANGLVWSSLNTWGWISIVAAGVQVTGGLLIRARKTGGMILGVLLGMLGVLVNLVSIGAYPIWSCVGLVCNVLVLYAVTVHGDELIS
jgi:hypothetical protein